MHFVRTEDLKTGMRLARPVYNKKSILLFDRNSLLSLQAIESIRNFGLIGVYVLEPAEPLPPLTQEDLEFERFQIQAVSAIEEEQDRILKTRKQNRTQSIADMVIRNYGHLDEKINFYQNLRSREDYFSRHSLNVAILCAMVTHVMNIRREEQYHTVCAAILHDMGKVKKHDACITGHLIQRGYAAELRRRKRPGIIEEACHRRIRHPQDLPAGSQKTAGPVPGRRREEQV
ncbi:MAG: HD domain-containing protein [Waltera sp.]